MSNTVTVLAAVIAHDQYHSSNVTTVKIKIVGGGDQSCSAFSFNSQIRNANFTGNWFSIYFYFLLCTKFAVDIPCVFYCLFVFIYDYLLKYKQNTTSKILPCE